MADPSSKEAETVAVEAETTEDEVMEDTVMVATLAEEEAAAAASAAKEEPKSLKDKVSVNNEWTEVEPEKVAVDDAKDDTVDDKHPIQKHMDAVVKTTQKAYYELGKNTQKTFEGLGRNTKGLVENVGKSTRSLTENVGKSTKDAMENVNKSTKGVLDTTKGALDEHVAPHIENVGRTSIKALDDFGKTTKGALDEHVAPHFENIKRASVRAIDSTKVVLDTHVAPHIDNVKKVSVKTMDDVGKGTVSNFETVKSYRGYYMGTAPSVKELCASDWKLQLVEGTFRAFGQVMFMNNPLSGLFVLIAMLVAFPLAALCALLCVLVANLTSLGLELDASNMASGIHGYNAVLVGAGVATLLDCAVWRMVLIVSVVAAPLTLVVHLYLYKNDILPLQLPYNGVMIVVLLSAMYLNALSVDAVVMSGWGWSVLLVVAMLFYSRILAVLALTGFFLSALLLPTETGMGAYNVVFTLAFFATQCVPSVKTLVLALIAAVFTGVIQMALAELLGYVNLPVLTLPFCFAVLPFVALGSDAAFLLISSQEVSTPEEHWKTYLFPETGDDLGVVTEEADDEVLITQEDAIEDLELGEAPVLTTEESEAPVIATEETPLIPTETIATEETPLIPKKPKISPTQMGVKVDMTGDEMHA
jgi:urea transporter